VAVTPPADPQSARARSARPRSPPAYCSGSPQRCISTAQAWTAETASCSGGSDRLLRRREDVDGPTAVVLDGDPARPGPSGHQPADRVEARPVGRHGGDLGASASSRHSPSDESPSPARGRRGGRRQACGSRTRAGRCPPGRRRRSRSRRRAQLPGTARPPPAGSAPAGARPPPRRGHRR
jgi:hypothetical protein